MPTAYTIPPEDVPSPPVRLSLPLDYQQEIFHELRAEDGLLVVARGLGLLRLVANLLHSYDAAGNNLILIVGADDRENTWLGEALAEQASVSGSPKCRGLQLVNTDMMSVGAREKMYSGGGHIQYHEPDFDCGFSIWIAGSWDRDWIGGVACGARCGDQSGGVYCTNIQAKK